MNRWLDINGPYIKNSVHQARERQKQQVRDIRQWCTPITKSTTPSSLPIENPNCLTTTCLSIKYSMKTIQDYFSGKPKRPAQYTAKNTASIPKKT